MAGTSKGSLRGPLGKNESLPQRPDGLQSAHSPSGDSPSGAARQSLPSCKGWARTAERTALLVKERPASGPESQNSSTDSQMAESHRDVADHEAGKLHRSQQLFRTHSGIQAETYGTAGSFVTRAPTASSGPKRPSRARHLERGHGVGMLLQRHIKIRQARQRILSAFSS